VTAFYGVSTAASAMIVNLFRGITTFNEFSTAGNANITNQLHGST
jgi:hypothetical protein